MVTLKCQQSLEKIQKHAHNATIPIIMHVAETASENEQMIKKYGLRSIPFLKKHGFLDVQLTMAHGVHLDASDMELISAAGAGVVHCPHSNMKLGSGIAPVVALQKAGCRVGLGTDGAASNNSLDLCQEMKVAVLLQRVAALNPEVMRAQTALEMATTAGASAIHLQDVIGSIEVGKRADIISIATNKPHHLPAYDPISTLVYASTGQDVSTVIIDGQIKLKDGTFCNIEASVLDVQKHIEEYKNSIQQSM